MKFGTKIYHKHGYTFYTKKITYKSNNYITAAVPDSEVTANKLNKTKNLFFSKITHTNTPSNNIIIKLQPFYLEWHVWKIAHITSSNKNVTFKIHHFLSAVTFSQKAPISSVTSICLCVSAWLPTDGFFWNFILENFMKFCWKDPNSFKMEQQYRPLCMKT